MIADETARAGTVRPAKTHARASIVIVAAAHEVRPVHVRHLRAPTRARKHAANARRGVDLELRGDVGEADVLDGDADGDEPDTFHRERRR